MIAENARVLAAVEALRAGDARRLGELLLEAHRSLAEDFEASLPEIDLLVALAQAESEVLGARLTGGGFGGSVVMLARPGAGLAAGRRLATAYRRATGRPGAVLVPVDRESGPRAAGAGESFL